MKSVVLFLALFLFVPMTSSAFYEGPLPLTKSQIEGEYAQLLPFGYIPGLSPNPFLENVTEEVSSKTYSFSTGDRIRIEREGSYLALLIDGREIGVSLFQRSYDRGLTIHTQDILFQQLFQEGVWTRQERIKVWDLHDEYTRKSPVFDEDLDDLTTGEILLPFTLPSKSLRLMENPNPKGQLFEIDGIPIYVEREREWNNGGYFEFNQLVLPNVTIRFSGPRIVHVEYDPDLDPEEVNQGSFQNTVTIEGWTARVQRKDAHSTLVMTKGAVLIEFQSEWDFWGDRARLKIKLWDQSRKKKKLLLESSVLKFNSLLAEKSSFLEHRFQFLGFGRNEEGNELNFSLDGVPVILEYALHGDLQTDSMCTLHPYRLKIGREEYWISGDKFEKAGPTQFSMNDVRSWK